MIRPLDIKCPQCSKLPGKDCEPTTHSARIWTAKEATENLARKANRPD